MIKKFNQFVKENVSLSNSSARIYIDSDEVGMFTNEPALQKLISDRKVSLLPPELWFESEDKSTIDILKGYFPDAEFNTEYEISNEEINLKGLAAGAMMALMTACNQGKVNDVSSEEYTGDMLVKKIEMDGHKHNFFVVHGLDKEGKSIEFATDNLTFNVGDSIHVDFESEKLYPLNDKDNKSSIQNYQ